MENASKDLKSIQFKAGAFLFLFIAAYYFPLKSIFHTAITNDDYSYVLLIPFVSLYLLWDNKESISQVTIKNSWAAFPFLLIVIGLSLYGILGSSGNIARPVVPVLLILFIAFCFGTELVKKLMLPLCFLFFMIPVPGVLERTLGFYLKLYSSKLGGEFIRLFDIPVYVHGNVIDLGVTQLQVVDACNGLRYLFPLIGLGILYAYFFQTVLWKRVVAVLATIPIAVLMNVIRIGVTGILIIPFGPEVAEGFFHGFAGWGLFLVAFAFLFLFGKVLSFFPPKCAPSVMSTLANTNQGLGTIENSPRKAQENKRKLIDPAFLVTMGLLLIVAWLSWQTEKLPALEIEGGVRSFPLTFSTWHGQAEYLSPEIIDASGAEEAFSAQYVNKLKQNVSLYIGYRGSAFLENENYFHSPTVCLPSQGWNAVETQRKDVQGVPYFGKVSVTRMVVNQMNSRYLVYFWFQTKDKVTHDKNINRFHLARSAIKGENTYTLFLRTMTPVFTDENVKHADERMEKFVQDVSGTLQSFLNKKVQWN